MSRYRGRVAGIALAATGLATPAMAADVTVPNGTTVGQQLLAGPDVLTVEAGGTVDGGADAAVLWSGAGAGVTSSVGNSGTITGNQGIVTTGVPSGNLGVVNNENASISATSDAIGIYAPLTAGDKVSISNSGFIESTGGGRAINLGQVTASTGYFETATITNTATGTIRATDSDAILLGNNSKVINYGHINGGTSGTPDSVSDAIKTAALSSIYVQNYGTIEGARNGISSTDYVLLENNSAAVITGLNGAGVFSAKSAVITNAGRITGQIDENSVNGDGDGIHVGEMAAGQIQITNSGIIEGLGAKGETNSAANTSEGIWLGGGYGQISVTNSSGGQITGKDNGVLAVETRTGAAISNEGTITGVNGYGILLLGDHDDSYSGSGTVSGGNGIAIDMGAGADSFGYSRSASFTGYVTGGSGTDEIVVVGGNPNQTKSTFDLNQLGNTKLYRDFEVLHVTNGGGAGVYASGTTDFAGSTYVDDGILILENASLANSIVTVEHTVYNGTLAGSGTIGGLVVKAGASVSPGTSDAPIGTLYVSGNVSFADKATYVVSTTPQGASDKILATGTTSISATAAVAVDAGGQDYGATTKYTIITSTGGVSGTFGSVTSNYLFLTPTLTYDPSNVYLTLARNDQSFAIEGTSLNQKAVAAAVETGGAGSGIYDTLVTSTSQTDVAVALTQLGGEIHATLPGVLFTQSLLVNDLLLSRLRDSSGAAPARPQPAPAAITKAPVLKAAPAPVQAGPTYATWAQGYGQWLNVDTNGNASAAQANVGGILVGADAKLGDYTFGLATGYASSNTRVAAETAETETFTLAAYGGAAFDALKLRAAATYGWNSTDTTRNVLLVGEQPTASYDGTVWSVAGEAGYDFGVRTVSFEPFAGIGWASVALNGFTESGAPLSGLHAQGTGFETAYSTLGLHAAVSFALENDVILRPHGTLGWRHAFGDVTPTAALAFNATGATFTIAGVPIAEDSLLVNAGLDIIAGRGLSVGVSYEGSFATDASYNAAKAVAILHF